MTDAVSRSALLADRRTPGRRAEIVRLIAELRTRLDALESAAHAAQPRTVERFGWAAFSMDTGLSAAQEDFVTTWSPDVIVEHCRAQRDLLDFLGSQATAHPGSYLELGGIVALLRTLHDALPR